MEDYMVVYTADGHRKAEMFQYIENVCQYCKKLRDFNQPYRIYQFTRAGVLHFLEGWSTER